MKFYLTILKYVHIASDVKSLQYILRISSVAKNFPDKKIFAFTKNDPVSTRLDSWLIEYDSNTSRLYFIDTDAKRTVLKGYATFDELFLNAKKPQGSGSDFNMLSPQTNSSLESEKVRNEREAKEAVSKASAATIKEKTTLTYAFSKFSPKEDSRQYTSRFKEFCNMLGDIPDEVLPPNIKLCAHEFITVGGKGINSFNYVLHPVAIPAEYPGKTVFSLTSKNLDLVNPDKNTTMVIEYDPDIQMLYAMGKKNGEAIRSSRGYQTFSEFFSNRVTNAVADSAKFSPQENFGLESAGVQTKEVKKTVTPSSTTSKLRSLFVTHEDLMPVGQVEHEDTERKAPKEEDRLALKIPTDAPTTTSTTTPTKRR